MCGILAAHGLEKPSNDRARFIACSKKQRHRGPDWSGCYVGQRSVLVHERLAIVGVGGYQKTNAAMTIYVNLSRQWRPTSDQRRWKNYPGR